MSVNFKRREHLSRARCCRVGASGVSGQRKKRVTVAQAARLIQDHGNSNKEPLSWLAPSPNTDARTLCSRKRPSAVADLGLASRRPPRSGLADGNTSDPEMSDSTGGTEVAVDGGFTQQSRGSGRRRLPPWRVIPTCSAAAFRCSKNTGGRLTI